MKRSIFYGIMIVALVGFSVLLVDGIIYDKKVEHEGTESLSYGTYGKVVFLGTDGKHIEEITWYFSSGSIYLELKCYFGTYAEVQSYRSGGSLTLELLEEHYVGASKIKEIEITEDEYVLFFLNLDSAMVTAYMDWSFRLWYSTSVRNIVGILVGAIGIIALVGIISWQENKRRKSQPPKVKEVSATPKVVSSLPSEPVPTQVSSEKYEYTSAPAASGADTTVSITSSEDSYVISSQELDKKLMRQESKLKTIFFITVCLGTIIGWPICLFYLITGQIRKAKWLAGTCLAVIAFVTGLATIVGAIWSIGWLVEQYKNTHKVAWHVVKKKYRK